jgi:hypothetical protein
MSELMVDIIVTLMVMLAVVFGAAALGIRLLFRRTPRVTGTVAAICVLAAINTPNLRAERYSEREQERIEATRQRFAPALERYRQEHGEYPSRPEAAGVKMPRTPYGRLHYFAARSKQGVASYHLAYGNNEINGFEALWSTETRKWEVFRFLPR